MPRAAVIATPAGPVRLVSDGSAVIAVHLGDAGPLIPPGDDVLRRAAAEVQEYFAGNLRAFTVPMRPPEVSPFRRRVWEALENIPYAETRTYGDLARQLGTSPRAVGGACARNELPLLIPCHRVVARSGLGGFNGAWETGPALSIKRTLLELEAAAGGRR